MKVLITGGYGFIGSHVAEQFYKEGYEVHILDNLSSGKKEHVTFKHKSYILNIEDPKCKKIFTSYDFEIVVHLAAQVSVSHSVVDPVNDAQNNILGLLNMLQLSLDYNVKKFIFASSAAIYGNNTQIPLREDEQPNPISPYGMSKWVGEQYCTNWEQMHGLETICLRFSNVYGPRQTTKGEGGVVSIFCSKALHNEVIAIHGDGTQTRDFIYVKDVAFAIYRASQSFVTGTYNLSTNSESSVQDILQYLTALHGPLTTQYTAARQRDIDRSALNNEAIKKMLDWVPLYSLKDGLAKTYEWASDNYLAETNLDRKEATKKPKKELPSRLIQSKLFIENTVFFIVLSTILLTFSPPFLSVFIFGVFYIMIVGSLYGNKQGFLGVVLSIILLIIDNLLRGHEMISLLYDTTFLFQISTFLFIGLVVGYSVQRKNNKIVDQKEQLEDLQTRYHFLEEIHTEMREVKDELQLRLKNNEDSFGKIYSIIKELDNLEPEKIFTNTVKVVERIMRCDNVSIYAFNQYHSFLRLVAHSETNDNRTYLNSIKVDDAAYIQQIIQTGQPYINRLLLPNTPLMVSPIYFNNELKAVIAINELPFENFSTYHENLFIVVKQLIQTSLGRAFEFMKATEDKRFISGTNVLKLAHFNEIVHTKEEAKTTYNMPYVLLAFPVDEANLVETAQAMHRLLRETDYLGFNQETLYILLSNTKDNDLPFILQRFQKAGFTITEEQRVIL